MPKALDFQRLFCLMGKGGKAIARNTGFLTNCKIKNEG